MICYGLVDWLIRYPMTAVVTVVFISCPTRGGQQRNQFNSIDQELSDLSLNCMQIGEKPGPGCSKLTTSLVNDMLKFQMLLMSQIHQYFLLEICEKLLQLLAFFQQKYQCIWK